MITATWSLQRATTASSPTGDGHAGGPAGPDRAAGRGLRLRLRQHGQPRQPQREHALPRAAHGAQSGGKPRFPWPASRTCCCTRAGPTTSTARRGSTRISGSSTGRRQSLPPPPGPEPPARAAGGGETVVVHDPWWTATARHADIVLPATTTLERNDIGASASDRFLVAMHQAIQPVGEARNDHDISPTWPNAGRPRGLHGGPRRDGLAAPPVRYGPAAATRKGVELPTFDAFWERGYAERRRSPSARKCCWRTSGPTRRRTPCPRPRAASSVHSARWRPSAMTTAPATRCGWSRWNGWGRPAQRGTRCTCCPPSPPPAARADGRRRVTARGHKLQDRELLA